jgi:hypothetical protein
MPAILELRRYALQPGRRDDLIALFDREFIESQEALGLQVLGQFRDLDDPDQFVWLRGFADMATRAAGLGAFYGGPVWQAHRAAANSTMIDSSNALLLRPAGPRGSFAAPASSRPPAGSASCPSSIVTATIYRLRRPAGRRRLRRILRGPDRPGAGCSGRGIDRRLSDPRGREQLPGPADPHRRSRLRLVRPFRR